MFVNELHFHMYWCPQVLFTGEQYVQIVQYVQCVQYGLPQAPFAFENTTCLFGQRG